MLWAGADRYSSPPLVSVAQKLPYIIMTIRLQSCEPPLSLKKVLDGTTRRQNARATPRPVRYGRWSALGCAQKIKSPSNTAPEEQAEALYGAASLEVVNESIFDVRVYVIRAGQSTRVGR